MEVCLVQSIVRNEQRNLLKPKRIISWILLIFTLPIIKFLLIKDQYVFYRQIEVFQRTNSDFVPLLFPFIVVLVNAIYLIPEIKNGYLFFVTTRTQLKNYIQSKLIVNALISFLSAFLLVFLPFIFVMYIEPSLNIISLDHAGTNPISHLLFEQLLNNGTLTYGIIYSFWVGINGVLYSTFALLLLFLGRTPLISFSVPFVYYIVGHFITQVLGIDYLSPMLTIFPFSLELQPIWIIFIPFLVLIMIVGILYFMMRKRLAESYE